MTSLKPRNVATSSVAVTPFASCTAVQRCAEALAYAHRVVVFTGAGMSAESSINTFRDPEVGVWKNKLALAFFAVPFGWRWAPSIAWWYYKKFHRAIAAARPNAGHIAVAQLRDGLQLADVDAVQVITQNVDALQQRAGSPAEFVYEVHGSVWRHRCAKHGHPMDVLVEGGLPATQPHCAICGSAARPDAVLFTENLPEAAWRKSAAAIQSLRAGDVLLVIGTSGVVQPAASLPSLCARGVVKIEINTEHTSHSDAMDIYVPFASAIALPQLLQLAREKKGMVALQEPE